jgi:Spy/CpxP family protein refolding chaperone
MRRFALPVVALVAGALAGGWLLGGLNSRAQDTAPPKLRGQLYAKWRELGLTDEQKQQVYKVQAQYRSKIADLQKQIAKLRKEERAKAEQVLTPAQRARLKELLSGGTKETDKPPPKDKPADKPSKDKKTDK